MERPDGFDLDRAWEDIVIEVERRRTTISVRVEADPDLLRALRWTFGSHQRVDPTGAPAGDRTALSIEAHSPRSFAAQIAGFGDGVEIIDAPDEVFVELADLADQLQRRYGTAPSGR